MKSATIENVMDQIGEAAEKIKSDGERVIEVMDVGDEVRQGDLYITMIAGLPKGATPVKRPQSQLAPGTTQGSRHTLRSLDGVTIHELKNAGPLDGPILVCENGCAIDHPEHGNRVFPAGVYAITYQRAYADEIRRVED
jgi:hypothetical protein